MVTSFFSTLSFSHALGMGFCCVMLCWAVLWSIEAHLLRKKLLHTALLMDVQKEVFTKAGIPFSIFYEGDQIHCNPPFLHMMGGYEDDLQKALLLLLKHEFHFETWDAFVGYLMLNVQLFEHVFHKNNTCFCLYARVFHKTVFLWIEPVREQTFDPKEIQAVVDLSPIPLWYRNAKGDITYCNDAYARIFGKDPRHVLEEKMEIIPKERAKSLYHQSQKALNHQKIITQQNHIVINGERRFVEMGVVPYGVKGSTGYLLDLHALDLAQKEQKLLIDSQKEMFEHLSTAVAIYGQDTKLVFFNRAYVNCFQLEEQWLLTQPTLGEVLEDLRSRRKIPEVSDFLAHKKNRLALFYTLDQPLQEVSHYPDGRMLRMMIVPYKLGGLMYLFDDMSESLTLESRYNTLIAVQNETIDNLFEGILVFGADHKLQIMNASFCKMMCLSQKETFLGQSLKECLTSPFFLPAEPLTTDQENQQLLSQTLYQQLVNLFDNRRIDHCMIETDGKRLLRIAYNPLPDGSHLLSLVDMTDTTRFQGRLKERNLMLEEQAVMRSHFTKDLMHLLSQLEQGEENSLKTHNTLNFMRTLLESSDFGRGPLTLVEDEICIQDFFNHLQSITTLFKNTNLNVFMEQKTTSKYFRGDQKTLLQGFWFAFSRLFKHCGDDIVFEFLIYESGEKIGFNLSMNPFIWKEQYTIGVNSQSFFQEKEESEAFYEKECGIPFLKRVIELHGGTLQIMWPNKNSHNLSVQILIPQYGQQKSMLNQALRHAG